MLYFILVLIFFLIELFYFRIAKKYEIIDVPNHRSAHQQVTIRGIGILFPIAAIAFFFISGFQYLYFVLGLLLISTVSFMDDIRPLPNRYRIIVHFLSVGLLLFELFNFNNFLGFIALPILFIVSVGIINAYNFMDGINGITGLYSLVLIATLHYINTTATQFLDERLMLIVGLSLIVFLFYNFRKKAIGFCGDVGSVSLAFIIIFCIGMLMLKSGEWKYIFLLSVYGIDTIYTILYRLKIGQNIFKAHKLHFFQLLVHEYKWTHLQVSVVFAFAQLMINIIIINYLHNSFVFYIPIVLLILLVHYFRSKKSISLF